MRKDIKNRDRPCEKCQRAKVFKHTKAPLSTFAHIHIDYIGPYPPSKGYKYCLTIIDRTATAGSDVVQSGRPIFDDFFQHLWPYIGNNTANVVFQMVKRLWLIRIDQ
ncbi:integrase catalytic domain-containing protein [Trichonephila clavipes]|nr:integrase catalytic domain-containing protein [Trichonephila clavipes]